MARELITTARQLDALQVGSILADRRGWPVWRHPILGWCTSSVREVDADLVIGDGAPLAVLYRPDAMMPGALPTVEAVARAITPAAFERPGRVVVVEVAKEAARRDAIRAAEAVLALLPGRTEAAVLQEAADLVRGNGWPEAARLIEAEAGERP